MPRNPDGIVTDLVSIDHARLVFRNFSGQPGKFNAAGRRNFCVLLDDPILVQRMLEDGWNIRYLRPRDDTEEPQPYLQVAFSYDKYPPKIWLISGGKKTLLSEDMVDLLDLAELSNVDLVLRPYNYNVSGRRGVKAYLKFMYATLAEDDISARYVDVPDSAMSAIFDRH